VVQREDDAPATIGRRLAVYHRESEPLLAHYGACERLREIDGSGPAEAVARRLRSAATAPA